MIKDNLDYIKKQIKEAKDKSKFNEDVLLVAVTKTRSVEEINEVISTGITDIGENKVQEIMDKYNEVSPVKWHLIGHLQTNKVKYIIDKVYMIHSVDSLKLAEEINKRAQKAGITMNILLQVNAAMEAQKFGLEVEEVKTMIGDILENYSSIRIRGLMCMAPFDEEPENVRPFFAEVKSLYEECKSITHPNVDFKYLSMGMSNDFPVAIEEGSNLVRVGTAIFGLRDYTK